MEEFSRYVGLLVLLVITELIYFKLANKFNIIDKPNLRSSHTQITLRGGGIVFYFGVLIFFLLGGWLSGRECTFVYPWFMLALTLITGISFIDDIRSTPQWLRLVMHFIAMGLLFYQCGIMEWQWWWIILVLIVCTGIVNAYNFMDGINGITGGYSLVVLVALLYTNQQRNFIDDNFLIVTILSLLVFNFFNFRKKAKCFAGDVGSVGIAFIILFALGKLLLHTGDFSYILFLAMYGIDSVLTIIHRIMLHENIGEPHRKHVYQLMANELKIPHVVVSLVYMGIQLVISFGLIMLPVNKWMYLGGVILLLTLAYILFKKKYYYLHEEYLRLKEI